MVFTGKGKGKTTSALGLAFRAMGHNQKVCVIQFIKGNWKYGELESAKRFEGLMDFYVMGKGFTWQSENLEEDIKIAQEAWNFAKEKIGSGKYQMVILDELTYLIKYNMVSEDEIISFLSNRPENLHIVVTGRDASARLIEIADLVTDMVSIKHPYDNGVKAQKGVEF
jgi:cob(I)alamin adenosyltransferase